MTIDSFLSKNPSLHSSNAYLERKFLYEVFYPDYGEKGLELLRHQTEIFNDSTGEKYYIDFTLETDSGTYAIETDGLYYHASGGVDASYFERLQRKQNEIINQGFKLVRLTSTYIAENNKDARYELRRSFVADPTMNAIRKEQSDTIQPHEIQSEALEALNATRDSGKKKGVVVFATGVGKTYLSAFDSQQTKSERILFIVHVKEILRQSLVSFEDVLFDRKDDMGFYHGSVKDTDKKILFASIQTIGSDNHMTQFDPEYFDYIVVDETHHVAAPSYAKIFEYFKPKKFFLGLTATPERMDKKEIMSFFDNNLVYEIDQKTAIDKALLVPYKYFGFKDNVDYTDIRWSGFKYNVQDLNKALMIERRDRAILEKFNEYSKERKTIGFCVSIEHAEYMAKLFNENGFKSIAIHSKVNSDENAVDFSKDVTDRMDAFKRGDYQVAFVVDMFNEGIDVKDVDSLLFLRPTESKTIFIQQMGRGLRLSPETKKGDVIILDFIGNYKTALRILGGLGLSGGSLREFKPKEDGSERESKLLYRYDNNGSQVVFQDDVIDVLKEIQAASTSEVQKDLIDDEWDEYGEFISNASVDNLYFKVGQQNKDMSSQLRALEVIENNEDISDDEFKEELASIGITGMSAGFRALFISKVLGLIDHEDRNLTSVYAEIKSRVPNGGEDFGVIAKYSDVLTRQLEKMAYWNPVNGTTNKYRSSNDQVDYNSFNNYLIPLINLVIIELNQKYGFTDYRISLEEIHYFIVFALNLSDYEKIAEMIARYRGYQDKPELKKHLALSSEKADSRVRQILGYVEYYEFNYSDGVRLLENEIDRIKWQVGELRDLIDSNAILSPSDNPDEYLKMLRSSESLITYLKNYRASS